MTTSTKSIRAGASSAQAFGDDALHAGENALETGRQYATEALGKAGETVRELRAGARDYASRGLSSVAESAANAQKQLSRYTDATTRYVADQPVKSALIAAAVGAVVAGIIIAARRQSDSRKSY